MGWLAQWRFAPSQFNQDTVVASGNRSDDERIQWQTFFSLSVNTMEFGIFFTSWIPFVGGDFWAILKTCSSIPSKYHVFYATPSVILSKKKEYRILLRMIHNTSWCKPFLCSVFFLVSVFSGVVKTDFHAVNTYNWNYLLNQWIASGQRQESAINCFQLIFESVLSMFSCCCCCRRLAPIANGEISLAVWIRWAFVYSKT